MVIIEVQWEYVNLALIFHNAQILLIAQRRLHLQDVLLNNKTRMTQTDTVIKYYITNPIIQKQITQQPSTSLTQLDTIQFCNLIKDQACVFTNSNFKILFSQMTKDSFGNWVLNGEAQNIASNPINNVRVILHLYDAQGNIIGLTQGLPTLSNLGIGQTTLFNLQENPTSLTGTPKFYRVSFDFLS